MYLCNVRSAYESMHNILFILFCVIVNYSMHLTLESEIKVSELG